MNHRRDERGEDPLLDRVVLRVRKSEFVEVCIVAATVLNLPKIPRGLVAWHHPKMLPLLVHFLSDPASPSALPRLSHASRGIVSSHVNYW